MRARDRADRIGRGDQADAERQSDAFLSERQRAAETARDHGGRADEHQQERAEYFCQISLHCPLLIGSVEPRLPRRESPPEEYYRGQNLES
jgi:hypothetical protein